jgi:hypothetical protein
MGLETQNPPRNLSMKSSYFYFSLQRIHQHHSHSQQLLLLLLPQQHYLQTKTAPAPRYEKQIKWGQSFESIIFSRKKKKKLLHIQLQYSVQTQ